MKGTESRCHQPLPAPAPVLPNPWHGAQEVPCPCPAAQATLPAWGKDGCPSELWPGAPTIQNSPQHAAPACQAVGHTQILGLSRDFLCAGWCLTPTPPIFKIVLHYFSFRILLNFSCTRNKPLLCTYMEILLCGNRGWGEWQSAHPHSNKGRYLSAWTAGRVPQPWLYKPNKPKVNVNKAFISN